MKEFMLIVLVIACAIGAIYVGWKVFQYVVYRLSNLVAKGIYDAKNGKDKNIDNNEEKPLLPKQEVCLSAHENKIRKDWRFAFFTYYVATALLFIACLVLGSKLNPKADFEDVWIEFGAWIFTALIQGGLMYLFAYVKMGTKWIGWFVFISPFGTLVQIMKEPPADSAAWIVQIIFIVPFVYLWVHCKKLYDLNHIFKGKAQHSDPKCLGLQNGGVA